MARFEEAPGLPLIGQGTEKYLLRDIRIRRGDWSVVEGDVETVTGVAGLAQKIENAILSSEDDRPIRERPRVRPQWIPPTPEDAIRRLRRMLESPAGRYYEHISCVRRLGDDLEVEFRATGYPGTYSHRLCLNGPGGLYDVVPVTTASIFAVDRINEGLLAELAKDPKGLDLLHPREFEHVVAKLVERMGYEVELTRATADDGVDILAVRREGLAPTLTVIDCKRYSRGHRFGPEIVRTIAGVREVHRANTSMIVTTAHFTEGARDLQRTIWPYQVSLADREVLESWLARFGWEQSAGVWRPA